jgi:hypothetical protein
MEKVSKPARRLWRVALGEAIDEGEVEMIQDRGIDE